MGYRDRDNRNNNVQPLENILKDIMGRSNMSKGIYRSRIPAAWETVMGPPVARVTRHVYFRDGVVYVSLYSSVIRNELMMQKDKIIQNLNNHIGAEIVKELILR